MQCACSEGTKQAKELKVRARAAHARRRRGRSQAPLLLPSPLLQFAPCPQLPTNPAVMNGLCPSTPPQPAPPQVGKLNEELDRLVEAAERREEDEEGGERYQRSEEQAKILRRLMDVSASSLLWQAWWPWVAQSVLTVACRRRPAAPAAARGQPSAHQLSPASPPSAPPCARRR